jgi:integration host factor subunit alpha
MLSLTGVSNAAILSFLKPWVVDLPGALPCFDGDIFAAVRLVLSCPVDPRAISLDKSAIWIAWIGAVAMAAKTITRADLCEAVYQKVGLSRTESAALVELVLKEITDCLERGETVKLSSFGSFVVRKKGQRVGRNPKTGKEVPISPRRVMVFKPSAILKQRINAYHTGDGKVPDA